MCWGQRGGEQGCPHPGGAGVQPSDSRASPSTAPSCGKSLPGTYTKVQKQESGDIHIWGRNVFMGYLDDEATTQERVDRHGWMHTGDLGFLDPEDFLYVVGSARGERGAASRALPPAPTAAAGSAAACAPHGAGGLRPSSEEGVPFVCRGSPGGEGQRRAPGAPLVLPWDGTLWPPEAATRAGRGTAPCSTCRPHHAQFRREDPPEPHRGAAEEVHPHCPLRRAGGPGRPVPVCPAHAQGTVGLCWSHTATWDASWMGAGLPSWFQDGETESGRGTVVSHSVPAPGSLLWGAPGDPRETAGGPESGPSGP